MAGNQISAVRTALIGFGNIGHEIMAQAATIPRDIVICGILELRSVETVTPPSVPVVTSLEELLATNPAVVVECAAQEALATYAEDVLRAGTDMIAISSGAFADDGLLASVREASAASGAQLTVPAGAIAAIDALAAASLSGLNTVTYRSRKPPTAWARAIGDESIDLSALSEPYTIYTGNAREAARLYPKNTNVAATVALAGIGFDATAVELVADPGVSANVHTIEAQGAFGKLHMEIENAPSPNNPRTSYITAFSIIRALKNRTAGIVV